MSGPTNAQIDLASELSTEFVLKLCDAQQTHGNEMLILTLASVFYNIACATQSNTTAREVFHAASDVDVIFSANRSH